MGRVTKYSELYAALAQTAGGIEFSEGIMGDGVAILCDGQPMRIEYVVECLCALGGIAELLLAKFDREECTDAEISALGMAARAINAIDGPASLKEPA